MRRMPARAAGFTCAARFAASACAATVLASVVLASAVAPGASGLDPPGTVDAATAAAPSASGLVVRPTSGAAPLLVPVAAGATVTSSVTLANETTDVRFEVRLGITDGAQTFAGAQVVGTPASWITTAAQVVTLEPGTTRDVPLTVQVPAGAPVGPAPAELTVTIERSTVASSGLVGPAEGTSQALPISIEIAGEQTGDLVVLGVAARADDDEGTTLAVRLWNSGSAPVSGYGAIAYDGEQIAFEVPEVGPRSEIEQRVPWNPGDERQSVSVYVTFGAGRVAQWTGTVDPAETDAPIAGSRAPVPGASNGSAGAARDGPAGDGSAGGGSRPGGSASWLELLLRAVAGAAIVIPAWLLTRELLRRRRAAQQWRVGSGREDWLDDHFASNDGIGDLTSDRAANGTGDRTVSDQLDRIASALEHLVETMAVPAPASRPPQPAPATPAPAQPVPTQPRPEPTRSEPAPPATPVSPPTPALCAPESPPAAPTPAAPTPPVVDDPEPDTMAEIRAAALALVNEVDPRPVAPVSAPVSVPATPPRRDVRQTPTTAPAATSTPGPSYEADADTVEAIREQVRKLVNDVEAELG